MNKETFFKRKKHIQEEIESWKEELRAVEEEYISSNQQFSIGSKVCITTLSHQGWELCTREKVLYPEQKRYAYIVGYEISYGDEVAPILMKAKKDGTISKNRDYISFENVTIELAQND